MAEFETLLALLAACIGLAMLARRIDVPLATVLVLGGMALALIPGLPQVRIDPELLLALFLPPLLQVSAYRTDWPSFRENLRPILLLAVGAVFFCAAAVAVVAYLLIPGLPWWAAVTLGAIVAPPDAVAATSVLKKFNLPRRLVVVLEGESLLNDASSLVLYRFAVTAVAAGSVDYSSGLSQFILSAAGGMAIGWMVGYVAMWVFKHVEDTLLDIAVSVLVCYAAYLGAEALHGSGVISAVSAGMLLGRKQHVEFTAQTRVESRAVWQFIEFILSALIFILIGLQLRGIVARLHDYDARNLTLLGLAVSATLIVSRFLWIFPATWLPRFLSPRLRASEPAPPLSHPTVLAWAGMRGVVSIAAALALPEDFPSRDIILFLAFCAILATLVLQGTTLGWLIKRLNVVEVDDGERAAELAQARAEVAAAALNAVKGQLGDEGLEEHTAAASDLVQEYEMRAGHAQIDGEIGETVAQMEAQQRLRLVAIEASRAKLRERIDDLDSEAMRALEDELDLEEGAIRRALGDLE